jgi:hypothetical protein
MLKLWVVFHCYNRIKTIPIFWFVVYGVYYHFQHYLSFIVAVSFYWWRKSEDTEKTTDLSQVTDKLYHIMYQAHLARVGFELATLVVIGTDCTGSCKSNYRTIMTMTTPWTMTFMIIYMFGLNQPPKYVHGNTTQTKNNNRIHICTQMLATNSVVL